MKILPFKIPKPNDDALVYQEDHELIFYNQFHQHEEIQISFIAKGHGALIVGNTINDYTKGDVLIIGSNLPHVFKSDSSNNENSLMISLFFTINSFGESFFEMEELKEIQSFFKKSNNGFKVRSRNNNLEKLFLDIKRASKLNRFIKLLQILKILTTLKHKPLSTYNYKKEYSNIEGKRMSEVIEYTMKHFQNEISLTQIAKVATMTKNSFCKYFKKRTNKTYIRFLNEVRIEHASKLILDNNDYSIAEIAERSGFNNISNFNRQFKSIKKKTPSRYALSLQ